MAKAAVTLAVIAAKSELDGAGFEVSDRTLHIKNGSQHQILPRL
jgi:hypothetical protein